MISICHTTTAPTARTSYMESAGQMTELHHGKALHLIRTQDLTSLLNWGPSATKTLKENSTLSLLCFTFQWLNRLKKCALCDVTKGTITPFPGVANKVLCSVEGPTTARAAENRGLNVHFSADLWRLIKCGSSTESRMKNNAFKMGWIWVTQY